MKSSIHVICICCQSSSGNTNSIFLEFNQKPEQNSNVLRTGNSCANKIVPDKTAPRGDE